MYTLHSTTAKGISFLKSGTVTALQGNGGKVTGVIVKTGAAEQQTLPADLVVVRACLRPLYVSPFTRS